MLIQSGTSYNIQCVDIRTNRNINYIRYAVQGKLNLSAHTLFGISYSNTNIEVLEAFVLFQPISSLLYEFESRLNTNTITYVNTLAGPPIITLNNGSNQSFSLLPPNINSASVTVLTQNVVLSTNLAGRWQRPDNSSVESNTLTFSTFYVTQGGVYKFYVDNWDGQQTLAIQLNINVTGKYLRCILLS